MVVRITFFALTVCVLILPACDSAQVPLGSPDIQVNPDIDVTVNVDGGDNIVDGDGTDVGDGGGGDSNGDGAGDFSATFGGVFESERVGECPPTVDCEDCPPPPATPVGVRVAGVSLTLVLPNSDGTLLNGETVQFTLDSDDRFIGPYEPSTTPEGSDDSCGRTEYELSGTLDRQAFPRTLVLTIQITDDCCEVTSTATLAEIP